MQEELRFIPTEHGHVNYRWGFTIAMERGDIRRASHPSFIAAYNWCNDQFGAGKCNDWGASIYGNIWFNNPTMATAFKLRWC